MRYYATTAVLTQHEHYYQRGQDATVRRRDKPGHCDPPGASGTAYTANSNTRNRIPGTNRTDNTVSCFLFRGVRAVRY
eukprot:1540250-Rhodomonas_salina.5